MSIGSGAGTQAVATTSATAHPVSSGAHLSDAAVKNHWTPAAMRSARVATQSVSGSAKANARGVTVAHDGHCLRETTHRRCLAGALAAGASGSMMVSELRAAAAV